jgi:G3E family GTPase
MQGPLLRHGKPGGIRAYTFRPAAMTWASWAAWSQLVAARFGARLLRVKGLLRMEDTGEIALVQGVQGVFHKPQRFRDWPDADHGNRIVCIARDIEFPDLENSFQVLKSESETHE